MNDIIAMEGLIKRFRDKLNNNKSKSIDNNKDKDKTSNIKDISLNEFRSEYKPILIKIYNYIKSEFNILSKKYPEVKYIFKLNGYKEDDNYFNSDDTYIEVNIVNYNLENLKKYDSNKYYSDDDLNKYIECGRCDIVNKTIDAIITNAVKKYGIGKMSSGYYGGVAEGPYSITISGVSCTELMKKIN